jgi:glycosyltransferase involved in cell wall biosynthesis
MAAPSISIVIPAYNAARHLARALASVFAQSYRDFEVIVVNDGSPDTPALESAIAPWRDGLRYLTQDNKGAAAARNTGLTASRGEWVAFLDADDGWEPTYLEQQLAMVANEPTLDLVYCDARLEGDSVLAGRTFMETSPSHGEVTVKALLSFTCNVITSGVLARRNVILAVDGFDESLRRGHDFNLWVRMAAHGARLGYHRAVLVHRRIEEDSLSGDAVSQYERALGALTRTMQVLELGAEERAVACASVARLSANLETERARVCLSRGDYAGAAEHIARANQIDWRLRRGLALALLCLSPSLLSHLCRITGRTDAVRRTRQEVPPPPEDLRVIRV